MKLLLSGYAVSTLKRLRSEGLHAGLLPLLDVVLDDPSGEKFVFAALANTDQRVKQDKPVPPSFLFAALLWHEVLKKKNEYQARGDVPYEALAQAMVDECLRRGYERVAEITATQEGWGNFPATATVQVPPLGAVFFRFQPEARRAVEDAEAVEQVEQAG